MKHVSIIVPAGKCSLSNIEGTQQLLTEVNGFLVSYGREPLFKIQLVGLPQVTSQRSGLYTIHTDCVITEVDKTDLIIIPALFDAPGEALQQNGGFIPWIVEQHKRGAEIASFCIGAFFLGATGLLSGRTCATHWRYANEFRILFPDANLVDDKIMTDDGGIYTSGGAYSFLNLLVYLVGKYAGRDIAILTAKTFMIDIDRESQSPFIMFSGQKEHDDLPVKQAQEYIEQHFQDKITIDQLAGMFALSRRNFERRFKKATSNTVVEYIQRVKMEAAKKDFEVSAKNINEVMYDVGYTDTKAFRTTFK
ncbi:MAG: helix-turn-helix domain-containing protein, partial [Taibaiella sp.]|nr:helix-turn-helix domain-containing protein [Taibaiella sp.]